MRRTFAHGRNMSIRALKWLVDVKHGKATGAELNEAMTGSLRGYAVMSVVRFLVRNGWATVREPEGEFNVNRCNIYVTDAGRLWRDYIEWEPDRLKLNRVELHARIRALEMALAPMARMYEQTLALGCPTSTVPSESELRFAHTVLHSPNDGSVIYPWTPGFVGDAVDDVPGNGPELAQRATHPLNGTYGPRPAARSRSGDPD